jgi:hypothetical protein
MGPHPPLAELPGEISFTLAEVADTLFAIDLAVERTDPGSSDRRAARRIQRLITSKLWPELGRLLGDDRGQGE